MSLAMFAASINNDDNNNDNDNYNQRENAVNRKRNNNNNKTQKRLSFQNITPKVNSVLESLHGMSPNDSNSLGDYNLIPPPSSAGVTNTIIKEGMSNQNNQINYSHLDESQNDSDDVDIQSLNNNYMNDKVVEKYYKNLLPTYNENKYKKSEYNKQYYPIPNFNDNSELESSNYKLLTDKLNYMINLLEEQQDEKTNNVTEEVVLYSFLGIFIIFLVDSFVRVGKYVR